MVATTSQMAAGKGFAKASQSFEDGLSFFAAAFIGPGRYSLDYYLGPEDNPQKSKMKRVLRL
jgi:putative oxidoreductase